MWRVIILVKVYSLLVSHVDCKLTALGDPIGPKGPTIIETPNKVDDDVKVATDAINAKKLDPDLVKLISTRTAEQRAAIDAAYLKASGKALTGQKIQGFQPVNITIVGGYKRGVSSQGRDKYYKAVTPLGDPIGPLGPTIIEKPNKVDDDVKVVTDAVNAKQVDAIAKLIGTRTVAQRIAIGATFLKATGRNISAAESGIIVGRIATDIRKLYVGFFLPLPEFLARELHSSLVRGGGDKDWTYMSILCTSSATKLKAISDVYMKVNGVQLEDDLKATVKDSMGLYAFQKMIDPKTMRPDSGTDPSKYDEQVKLLPTDDSTCTNPTLMDFLASSSFAQIKEVVNLWKGKKSVKETIKKECPKGVMQEAYKRIVRYAVDPYEYFAEEFHLGMIGNSFNGFAHTYLLTSRSEIDLKDISESYKNQYKSYPIDEVKKWSDADLLNIFVAVLTGNT